MPVPIKLEARHSSDVRIDDNAIFGIAELRQRFNNKRTSFEETSLWMTECIQYMDAKFSEHGFDIQANLESLDNEPVQFTMLYHAILLNLEQIFTEFHTRTVIVNSTRSNILPHSPRGAGIEKAVLHAWDLNVSHRQSSSYWSSGGHRRARRDMERQVPSQADCLALLLVSRLQMRPSLGIAHLLALDFANRLQFRPINI